MYNVYWLTLYCGRNRKYKRVKSYKGVMWQIYFYYSFTLAKTSNLLLPHLPKHGIYKSLDQRYIKEIELLLVAREIYSGILGKNYLGYR